MTACPKHLETIYLDVYGELSPEQRASWEEHLAQCIGCRQQRARLLDMLEAVRKTMPEAAMSDDEASALRRSIIGSVRAKTHARTQWPIWRPGFQRPRALVLAAAALLMVVLGWVGVRQVHWSQRPQLSVNEVNLKTEERTIVQNLEVLENLELLKEMDIVKTLVKVVDNRDAI